MWIWGDVFSAGIEPGTLRITKFLKCRALHHWAMVTDDHRKSFRTLLIRGNVQTRWRGHCKSLQPLRVASRRGNPSEESCAGRIQTWFEIDNTQLVWESYQDIRCVVLFESSHWLLCVCKIKKTLVCRSIPHTICTCHLTQVSTYICPSKVSAHIYRLIQNVSWVNC